MYYREKYKGLTLYKYSQKSSKLIAWSGWEADSIIVMEAFLYFVRDAWLGLGRQLGAKLF